MMVTLLNLTKPLSVVLHQMLLLIPTSTHSSGAFITLNVMEYIHDHHCGMDAFVTVPVVAHHALVLVMLPHCAGSHEIRVNHPMY